MEVEDKAIEAEEEIEVEDEEIEVEGINEEERLDEGIDEGRVDTEDRHMHDEPRLSNIQKACLRFCIKLLNHSITRTEYNSPLVYTLAVLGVREDGWKGPKQYPPILSRVIKVA